MYDKMFFSFLDFYLQDLKFCKWHPIWQMASTHFLREKKSKAVEK